MSNSNAQKLVLGIDLSNIRLGGGVTHIKELVNHFSQEEHQFSKIIMWGSINTLKAIPDSHYLKKISPPILERGLAFRFFWQTFLLSTEVKNENCSVLFVPGGTFLGAFKPYVIMSQNLLPFDYVEIRRFGFSLRALKFILLRELQKISFKHAQGVIFLSNYSKDVIIEVTGRLCGLVSVIPHGLAGKFLVKRFDKPRHIGSCSELSPFRIMYVSNIDVYKHQIEVIKAVEILRERGYFISLDFIGPPTKRALKNLKREMKRADPGVRWVRYLGMFQYDKMKDAYRNGELAIFASSCETFGITLLEKMASGLPVACSNKSSMFEILEDGGLYFDPEDPLEIANIIETYLLSPELRVEKRKRAYEIVNKYTWRECAAKTFGVLAQIAIGRNK